MRQMVKMIFFIAFLIVNNGNAQEMKDIPDLFDEVSSCFENKELYMSYTCKSKMQLCFDEEIDGIYYVIGFSYRYKRVEYIATSDPSFVSPEGFSIGTTVKDMKAIMDLKEFNLDHEREYWWVRLPSGWCAAFKIENREDPHASYPTLSSEIINFYKCDSYEFSRKRQETEKDSK